MKKKCYLIIAAFVSPFSLLAAPAPTAVHPDNTETWISFLPVIFFLLILIVTAIKLRKVDGQSSGLLAEKDKQAAMSSPAMTNAPLLETKKDVDRLGIAPEGKAWRPRRVQNQA